MYVKLFAKILDSSVWEESAPTKVVWITLLASVDADGFCQFATIEALARRAKQKPCHVREAVAILEAPDKNSSTPSDDGRRIERVPGGWYILNAKKYREISDAGELRKSRRSPSQPVATCNNSSQLVTSFPLTTNGINKSLPDVEVDVDTDKEPIPVRFKVESFDGQEAFEDLCKHYKRAERSVIASRRYFEAVEWVVEHKKIPRQEAAAYIRERAELYCSKCKFQKGLTRWLEEKIFEQDESAWSDIVNVNGGTNGQNQRNGNTSLGKQADRNEANRDAILAGIFGGNAGGNAAPGCGTGEDDAHPGGIGYVGKAGTKLLT